MALASYKIKNTIFAELYFYFCKYLKDSDRAKGTIANISRDISRFFQFLEEHEIDTIDAEIIKDYISELEAEYRVTSYASKLSSLRQFVNWLNLEDNPFWDFKFKMGNEELDFYSKEEILTSRDLLIWSLYEFHLSTEELLELRIKDFNSVNASLTLRGIELEPSDNLAKALKNYIQEKRPKYLEDGEELSLEHKLFIVSKAELRDRLSSYNLKAQYIKRSRIVHLYEEGKKTRDIEEQLGLQLGDFYRAFEKDPEYRLKKAYAQFHPRASL